MKQILCKLILILSIILISIGIGTDYWIKTNLDIHMGLWNLCFNGKCFSRSKLHSVLKFLPIQDENKIFNDNNAVQGLTISAVVVLLLALVISALPNKFKYKKIVSIVMILMAVILLSTAAILYADEKKKIDKVFPGDWNYGYSFYLIISGVILALIACSCEILDHSKNML